MYLLLADDTVDERKSASRIEPCEEEESIFVSVVWFTSWWPIFLELKPKKKFQLETEFFQNGILSKIKNIFVWFLLEHFS